MEMRGHGGLGVLVLAALEPTAAAASPFETLDPYPAASLQISSTVDYARSEGAVREVVLTHGAATRLAGNVEGSLSVSHGWTTDGGDHSKLAVEPSLAVKWRLHEGSRWAVAIEPGLSATLGQDDMRLSLPVGAAWRSGSLALRWALGYDHAFAEGEGAAFAGVLTTYALAADLALGVELAADAPIGQLSDPQVRGNVGFIWSATDRIEIHGLAGGSLRRPGGHGAALVRLVLQATF